MPITITILILSGVVIFFMGYLIRKKQCLWLLCEYREGRVEDIDGLAKWAGILVYLMASVLVLTGLLYHFFPGRVLVITLVMWFIVMKLVIIMPGMVVTAYAGESRHVKSRHSRIALRRKRCCI